MIFSLPCPYLRYTRSMFCLRSSRTRKFLMNPSSLRSSTMRIFSLEDGMSTFSCSARLALRMRVSRSAMGSLFMIASPARLDHARHLALEGQLPEAQTAELELPQVAARASTQLTAAIGATGELRGALRLHDERGLGHSGASSLNGMPRCVRSALASSSVRAVVTMLTSIPRTLSILS